MLQRAMVALLLHRYAVNHRYNLMLEQRDLMVGLKVANFPPKVAQAVFI